jgi:hypothetical protein
MKHFRRRLFNGLAVVSLLYFLIYAINWVDPLPTSGKA